MTKTFRAETFEDTLDMILAFLDEAGREQARREQITQARRDWERDTLADLRAVLARRMEQRP